MALNCVMTGLDGLPIWLPAEKEALSVPSVEMTLQPVASDVGTGDTPYAGARALLGAKGTVYVTNKRIVFVSAKGADATSRDTDESMELSSLSIPLRHFLDSKLVQPWLSANYVAATIIPVPNGGLDHRRTLQISFKEGKSFDFHTILEEMKSRDADTAGGAAEEPLPRYEPSHTRAGPSIPTPSATRFHLNPQVPPQPESTDHSPESVVSPDGSTGSLTDADLEAARVAREMELDEAQRELKVNPEGGAASNLQMAGSIENRRGQQGHPLQWRAQSDGQPPGYQP